MSQRVLYFDCFSGIAGDMTLGALIDLGADVNALRDALKTLPVEGWTLETQVERKMGLRGIIHDDSHSIHQKTVGAPISSPNRQKFDLDVR